MRLTHHSKPRFGQNMFQMENFNLFKFNGKISTLETWIWIEVQIGNFALNNPSGEPKHGS